jgi:hypothetical protein
MSNRNENHVIGNSAGFTMNDDTPFQYAVRPLSTPYFGQIVGAVMMVYARSDDDVREAASVADSPYRPQELTRQ